jgi:hypothetical protein
MGLPAWQPKASRAVAGREDKHINEKDLTMNQEKSTATILAELKDLFGPPPVLSTENAKAYDEIMLRLIECFAPRDFMEQLLMKQLTDCTWDMKRYTCHKTLSIERKFRQRLGFLAKRVKAAAQNADGQARRPAEGDGKPVTELVRMYDLEDFVHSTVQDVDAILERLPAELDHARALEAAIEYHARLDELLNTAIARRNDVLDQLERYRRGLGGSLRKVSNEIIDAEFSVAELEPTENEVPLAPSIEEGK